MRWLTLLVSLSALLFWAVNRLRPLRRIPLSQPNKTYDEAMARWALLLAHEDATINPLCRTQLLSHAHRTQNVYILLHGFTNCPHQFFQFAAHLYEQGANVLKIRLPRHGMADALTDQLRYLTAEEMVALTSEVIDIAHGLGEEVTLLGFSLGGILAGWAAQQRPDLDRAILVSPAMGIVAVSPMRSRLLANLLAWTPNSFRWWDPVKQAQRSGPAHAYPRFATRALGELLRLGCIVQAEARRGPPRAGRVIVITNPCDNVVDNRRVAATVAAWRRHGARIETHEFPATWQLIHDLMDPSQPQQQIARVYPQLLAWINGV
jgi:alpha-beta hydrolase superfamily lysophospholipase